MTEKYYEVRESPGLTDRLKRCDTKEEADKFAKVADQVCHGRITIWEVTAEQVPVPWATTDGF